MLRQFDVDRQQLERHPEQDRRRDGARQHLPEGQVGVRQHVVGGGEEQEDAEGRDDDRNHRRREGVPPEAGVALQHLPSDRTDDEGREQGDERADHHHGRQRLAVEKAAVRPAVDDVERTLEHAEEREG